MRLYKGYNHIIIIIVIISLLYPNLVYSRSDKLAPQSKIIEEVAKRDIQAAYLLRCIFHAIQVYKDPVDFERLWELIQEANSLRTTIPVRKGDQRISILAKGIIIEFSTNPSDGAYPVRNSVNLWVRLSHNETGNKFKGLPVDEVKAQEIIARSRVEDMDEGELDGIETAITGLIRDNPSFQLPDNLSDMIYARIVDIRAQATAKNRPPELSSATPAHATAVLRFLLSPVDSDLDTRLSVLDSEIGLARKYMSSTQLPGDIPLGEILGAFREMRGSNRLRIFTPHSLEDLRYFMDSVDQHTSSIMLRDGRLYLLNRIWRYLDLTPDQELRRKLKLAFVMHEVVEQKLSSNGIPWLVSHLIAELFERFILGDELSLKQESSLDRAIREYFEVPGTQRKTAFSWLMGTLDRFRKTVPADEFKRARERCQSPSKIGIMELIKRLRDETVKSVFSGFNRDELKYLERLLFDIFISPQIDIEGLPYFEGFSGDKYDFAALLNLYIDAMTRPVAVPKTDTAPSQNVGFLKVDQEKIRNTFGTPSTLGFSVRVSAPRSETSEARFNLIVQRILDVLIEHAGQELDRQRLAKAIDAVVVNMRSKDNGILERLAGELEKMESLNLIFLSNNTESGFLFEFNRETKEIKINLDVFRVIKDPKIIEVLIAVGLFGHLLLGYSRDTIDILRAWQGVPATGAVEKRDMTPEGILRRLDVETTFYVLSMDEYWLAPASFVFSLNTVSQPEEKYPEACLSFTYSPMNMALINPKDTFDIENTDIPGMAAAVRRKIYRPKGSIIFRHASGDYELLSHAIAQAVFSSYIKPEKRLEFISEFSNALSYLLGYAHSVMWNPGAFARWQIGWELTKDKINLWIEYPVVKKRRIPDVAFAGLRDFFSKADIESHYNNSWVCFTETVRVAIDIPKGAVKERLSASQGWRRNFQGFIREDVPGYAMEDPEDPQGADITFIEIDPETGHTNLNENFSGVDIAAVEEIIQEAFRLRKQLFGYNPAGREKRKIHFIHGSKTLFGNHSRDGIAWVNIDTIRHLLDQIRNRGYKTATLGIVLGVGISHELLGHEAGIHDDERLSKEDAELTKALFDSLLGDYFPRYIALMRRILKEVSPYIREMESYVKRYNMITHIAEKILEKDNVLVILNNLGILDRLVLERPLFRIATRFRSVKDAVLFFNTTGRQEDFLRLIIAYYITLAGDTEMEGLPNAIVDRLINNFDIQLSDREREFLTGYVAEVLQRRSDLIKKAHPPDSTRLLSRGEIEREILNTLRRSTADNEPGLLYFDIDKLLEEEPSVAQGYMDILEGLSGVDRYAVVIVNTDKDKTIEDRISTHRAIAGRLRGIIGKSIILEAREMETKDGRSLIAKAIWLARERLGVSEIPHRNITLAIYSPNIWLYPEGFLKRFSVIIMTAKPIELDDAEIKTLDRFFPGIADQIRQNQELLRREELREMNKELESRREWERRLGQQA